MRGIATVIVVGFSALVVFGLVAAPVLEPIAQFVVQDPAVQESTIDAQGIADGILTSILSWGVVIVLGAGVASAVVWYLRRERVVGRRR